VVNIEELKRITASFSVISSLVCPLSSRRLMLFSSESWINRNNMSFWSYVSWTVDSKRWSTTLCSDFACHASVGRSVKSAWPQNRNLTGYLPQISQYFNRCYVRESIQFCNSLGSCAYLFILDVPTGCQHAVTDIRSVGISARVEGPR
jgi:hypothetical protein